MNEVLYICVFGESLLNDAVSVALYHLFEEFVELGEPVVFEPMTVLDGAAHLVVVALGGVAIGIFWAVITALTTKWWLGFAF